MTTEFIWNSRKWQEKFDQYSDQKYSTGRGHMYRDLQPTKLLLSTFEFWRSFQLLSAVFCFHWLSYAGPHCPQCSLVCLHRELLSSCSIYRQVADKFKSGFRNKWINRLFIPLKSNIENQTGKFYFLFYQKYSKSYLNWNDTQ